MIWKEISYNKYNNSNDPFRNNELYDENIDESIEYSGFELDIIEMFEDEYE